MRIREAAERLGISERAIRFYEKQGLLKPSRTEHNLYREFGEDDIWRLQTIVAQAGLKGERRLPFVRLHRDVR